MGHELEHAQEALQMCIQAFSPIYKSRSNFGVVRKWVMGPS